MRNGEWEGLGIEGKETEEKGQIYLPDSTATVTLLSTVARQGLKFLPRDASAERGYEIALVCLSVCPSVCLSVRNV